MSQHRIEAEPGDSVLVCAPIGRDAVLTRDILDRVAIPCVLCPSLESLRDRFVEQGGGAMLLTEEALDDPGLPALIRALEEQPPWSDVPVLLFAGGPAAEMPRRTIRAIETLRNVTLLDRPMRVAAVFSTVRAALRSRARQYEVRDLLTALHRARAEAESANRLKDEFLATLSHELRTPLNAILGWTSMLVRGQVEASRLPRVFDVLDRNAQSQEQLIADILDVSRIITGKLQLQPAAANVCEIVAGAADAVRPGASAKGVTLSLVEEPAEGVVYGDPDRLRQVFWNLLSNAVKFTPAGGTVRIAITRDAQNVAVAVTDTGAGIPREFVPFVFDRFRQADQTTTRAHGGLGLGLAIVKHLTELHGGTVTAKSDGPGTGACFEVRLPAQGARLGARKPQTQNASRNRDVRLDGYSILVIDDDESTREVVAAALEHARASVRVASNAADGWRCLVEHPPHLIIADLGMPTEDGFSFLRRVRASDARTVPALALSAYADSKSQESAFAAGYTAFLAKPAPTHLLLERVEKILGGAHPPDPSAD